MSIRGYNRSLIKEDKESKQLHNIKDIVYPKSFLAYPSTLPLRPLRGGNHI